MAIETITATIAGICMAICQIPQALMVYRTGNTDGTSLHMQIILTSGILFWFVTGLLLKNPPMYLSNGICLIFCLYVLGKKISNEHKKKKA